MAFGSELEPTPPLPVAGSNQREEEEEGGEVDRFDEGETKR